jgi:hypothetical protein
MPALPPKADTLTDGIDVRFVPIADIRLRQSTAPEFPAPLPLGVHKPCVISTFGAYQRRWRLMTAPPSLTVFFGL